MQNNKNNAKVNLVMSEDVNLRTTFNRDARLYHESRPRYPEELFDALVTVTRLPKDAKLLEIGPGTGQATTSLAKRGYKITAVELGVDLAEVARQELKAYPNVEIITGAFEEVELPPASFDLVYAATAFHWIDPKVRFTKPHNLLVENGHLAIIHTNHVSDEQGDRFFVAAQPVYQKYQLDDHKEVFRLPRGDELSPDELDTDLFGLVFFRAFPLIVKNSAEEYAHLISTYSPIIAMRPELRAGFLKDISHLIEAEFGGSIEKHFAMTLTIATLRPSGF
jgi:SAM-dependent methyltransferase